MSLIGELKFAYFVVVPVRVINLKRSCETLLCYSLRADLCLHFIDNNGKSALFLDKWESSGVKHLFTYASGLFGFAVVL